MKAFIVITLFIIAISVGYLAFQKHTEKSEEERAIEQLEDIFGGELDV